MAKDFVFRIKPGDPLPPIAPSGYRFMIDESTGSIKLLSSNGVVVNPTSDALVPTITDLQSGDFLYSNDGIGFQNANFNNSTVSVISNNFGFLEYTYVNQTLLSKDSILEMNSKRITLIDSRGFDFETQYVDVERIILEISPKVPFTFSGDIRSNIEFTGQASGAIGDIDSSFITATQASYVVQHSNKFSDAIAALPNTLDNDEVLQMSFKSAAFIDGGDASMKVTVFYKIRDFGAPYSLG